MKGYTKVGLIVTDPGKAKAEQEERDYNKMMNRELTPEEIAELEHQQEMMETEDNNEVWNSFG